MVKNRTRNISFLSTFPPRECGLATFTEDIVKKLDNISLLNKPSIIAVNNAEYDYSHRVIAKLKQYDRNSYIETAHAINNSNTELLVIEHEYGIFGGKEGEYLIDLINNLKIPFVTTLHTILPKPNSRQRKILKFIGEKSEKVITMAKNTVPLLEKIYEIHPSKIEIIHHGVPYRILESREKLKEKFGYKGLNVISTFGLVNPGKGLEYGIKAIADVVKEHKDVIYIILGQTHPCLKMKSGEKYRNKLINMVNKFNLQNNVKFIDKYLSKDEIINYLGMSDVYLTPYLSKDQAVSGTLAYAVGYGRVVVSTPYSYAREMLSDGRGLLAGFYDSNSLAKNIKYVLNNSEAKKEMEAKTLDFGRNMYWDNIAIQYTKLFIDTIEEQRVADALVM